MKINLTIFTLLFISTCFAVQNDPIFTKLEIRESFKSAKPEKIIAFEAEKLDNLDLIKKNIETILDEENNQLIIWDKSNNQIFIIPGNPK